MYRARDRTLGRQVAIKILPDAFAADPERLARFERRRDVDSRRHVDKAFKDMPELKVAIDAVRVLSADGGTVRVRCRVTDPRVGAKRTTASETGDATAAGCGRVGD